jgi:hypothetical protein
MMYPTVLARNTHRDAVAVETAGWETIASYSATDGFVRALIQTVYQGSGGET